MIAVFIPDVLEPEHRTKGRLDRESTINGTPPKAAIRLSAPVLALCRKYHRDKADNDPAKAASHASKLSKLIAYRNLCHIISLLQRVGDCCVDFCRGNRIYKGWITIRLSSAKRIDFKVHSKVQAFAIEP